VCDECNLIFGSHYQGLPPVETVLKETFNISRLRLLDGSKDFGKNKTLSRFSSIYFNVDMKKHSMALKQSYKFHKGFQEKICRQLKKGIYKIFLEEAERQKGNGHDSQFDFIREFARYNLGDYPVIYFERLYGIIAVADDWLKNPQLFFDEESQFKYLVREPSFMEFEFMGHVFSITTSRHWELSFDNYIRKSVQAKIGHFRSWRLVNNFNDIDLTLSILNGNYKP